MEQLRKFAIYIEIILLIMAVLLKDMPIVAITLLVILIALSALKMSGFGSSSIDRVTNDIHRIQEGQFNIILKKPHNAIASALVNELNSLMSKFRNLMATFIDTSDSTMKASDNLKEKADHLKRSSHEISKAIDSVAESACQQAEYLSDIENRIRSFVASNEEIEVCAANTYSASIGTKDIVKESLQAFSDIQSRVQESEKHNGVFFNELNSLKDRIGEINTIIAVVDGIAAQTRLLALNASIEAARAGDAGKGFAVVATEVGKLADSSSNSSREISVMVKIIIDGITELSKLAEEEEVLVQTTLKSVEELTSKSMNIEAVLTRSISESEKITALTKSQGVNSKDLQVAIASISEISQNNAAVSQEISATSEDQIISVDAVMNSINEMVQGVNETKTYTNNFIKGFVINESIKSKISDLKNILNEMVKQPEIFKGNRKTIENFMLKYQNSTDYIELMIFIGPDGFGIAETKGLEDKYWKDCTMKGYFHAAMKGETYISKEYISKSSGNYNITLSVPVKEGGNVIGVIMADIDINEY